MIFAGEEGLETVRPLLGELAQRYPTLKDEETEVLLVLPQSSEQAQETRTSEAIVFPVVADQAGKAHRAVGATDSRGTLAAAVLLADRFGEVRATYYTGNGDSLHSAPEIVDWFRYIELECPE